MNGKKQLYGNNFLMLLWCSNTASSVPASGLSTFLKPHKKRDHMGSAIKATMLFLKQGWGKLWVILNQISAQTPGRCSPPASAAKLLSKSQGSLLTNNPRHRQDGAPWHHGRGNARQETGCGSAPGCVSGKGWERLQGLGPAQTLVPSAVPERFQYRSQRWPPALKLLSPALGRCLLHFCLLKEGCRGCAVALPAPRERPACPHCSVAPATSSDTAPQHPQQLLVPSP